MRITDVFRSPRREQRFVLGTGMVLLLFFLFLVTGQFLLFADEVKAEETVETGPIPSGVYAIRNTYSDMYLDIVRDAYYAGSYIQQYNYDETRVPQNNGNKRLGLYKVHWVGGNDYVIRTMINNINSFVPVTLTAGSYLQTVEISVSNTMVGEAQLWTITKLSNGKYTISPKNAPTLAIGSQSQTSSGGGYTNTASRLVLQNKTASTAQWEFHLLDSNITHKGVELTRLPSTPLLPGVVAVYDGYMYTTDLNYNGPLWFDIVNADSSTETRATITLWGQITVEEPGPIYLRAHYGMGPNDYVSYFINLPEPFDGTFYLLCHGKDGHVDVSNSANVGEVLECNEENESNRDVWRLLYQDVGYYAIQNDVTGYYLTEVNGEAKQTAKSGSFTDAQLWKFEKQDDGSVKLLNKSKQQYLAHQDVAHNLEDPDIVIVSGNLGTRQQWWLMPYIDLTDEGYLVNLSLLYDQAYDGLVNDPQDWIGEQIFNADELFWEEFRIILSYGSAMSTISYADSSNCSSDPEEACTHGECENSTVATSLKDTHHRNIHNSLLRLTLPDPDELYTVLFFGHYPCEMQTIYYDDGTTGEDHTLLPQELGAGEERPFYGMALLDAGVIGITYKPSSQFGGILMDTSVLIHEIGHLFGAPDHETAKVTATLNQKYYATRFENDCIYGPNRLTESVYTNFTICPGCQAQIMQGRYDASHA